MSILLDLSKKYKTLSIVGMAKNAGKTTALNYLIEEADDEGVVLGITSTGRDGETTDVVTGTDKPRVFLYEDTIVSVPSQLYDLAEAGLEIVKKTDYRTSIGEVLLCRVCDSGYVQIAGPVAVADTKKMCAEMFEFDCDMPAVHAALKKIKAQTKARQDYLARLGEGSQPYLYVIVATGNIYEDVIQAQAAARQGADVIAVIRTTAQSLLDYVPYGPTTEGFGGTYATQENFRIMPVSLAQYLWHWLHLVQMLCQQQQAEQ